MSVRRTQKNAEYMAVPRPKQTLWTLVREGRVNEQDVDCYGRLRTCSLETMAPIVDVARLDLIKCYEAILRRVDACDPPGDQTSIGSPLSSDPLRPSSNSERSDVSPKAESLCMREMERRLDALERDVAALRSSLHIMASP